MIITGLKIYTAEKILPAASLTIANGKIKTIASAATASKLTNQKVLKFPSNYHLIPGMIDLHIHGVAGADVMDATPKALATICEYLPREGTTAFLATTMTEEKATIAAALSNVKKYIAKKQQSGAEILGVHLEGPFLSPKQMGAQQEAFILKPNVKLLEQWQALSGNAIKQVTYAPEECVDNKFTQYLTKHNIIAALGHSDATYKQVMQAIKAGCHHATHLFNAMRGLHQRDPGAVGAILAAEKMSAELIADGVHVHPAIVKLIYKIKGRDKLILVTDAMRAKCLGDGSYDLGGQQVTVKQQEARLTNGALAGSVLKMIDAANNMRKFTQCALQDVIKMTAENPAKLLNVYDRKGSIAQGKDADLVVLDNKFNIVLTICSGKITYKLGSGLKL